ncbi:MAG: DegT/DnrJ/EryC1/StrS family aminotransferase [Lachnospiraceae bacterium]|jgi:dTDP-4-amino-4,6-dideoxygalactose transaminase|nr:DegT/DnrJ/EryC1/StrS family aminotransferase [Lachnospiraceae bacterium]
MIHLFSPLFYVDECLEGIRECLEKGWAGPGEKSAEFEREWRTYTGYEYSVFLNSATAGLELTFKSLKELYGWQEKDEVITTPITFVSTNHAIVSAGLKPVFADINDTLCLDPGSVRERITDRTRAVAFVGIGGNTGDIKEVSQICKEKGLKLVLDAAHMSGTKMKGESLEKLADISIYSFQSTKVLLTADGGMVCCHEKELEKRIRTKAFVGLDKTRTPWSEKNTQRWYYDITDLGGSYLGNDIMAAIGLAQYRHLDSDIELRHKIANSYKEKLSGCDKVRFIRVPGDCYSAQWLFQIVVPKRDALMEYLESKEIFAGLHYLDNTQFRHYCYAEGTCPNADYYSRHMVSLPFHLRLTEEDISRVAENIIEFCEDYRSDKT